MFWENGDFFDKIWAWELRVFLENGPFLKKYGLKSSDFFIKNNEKRHLFVFLVHNKPWLWQNWLFLSIIGITGDLYEKAEKNDMRAQCFLENRSYFDKIWAWEQFFYLNRRFFWQYMGIRAVIFSWKMGKKDILLIKGK